MRLEAEMFKKNNMEHCCNLVPRRNAHTPHTKTVKKNVWEPKCCIRRISSTCNLASPKNQSSFFLNPLLINASIVHVPGREVLGVMSSTVARHAERETRRPSPKPAPLDSIFCRLCRVLPLSCLPMLGGRTHFSAINYRQYVAPVCVR